MILLGELSGFGFGNTVCSCAVLKIEIYLPPQQDTVQFMNARFEPELSGGSLAAQNVALSNPEVTQGKAVFERESCNACHGDSGIGTAAGPKLIGVGEKHDSLQLESLLRNPTKKMTTRGMPPVDLKDKEMKAMVAYLQSLK
jgi:mono/diheme cytochrome c family protein